LIADAVENLQQLGWLPFGTHVLWNSSSVISEGSSLGDVLHAFFGYAEQPTVLQVGVWALYLAIAATAFIRRSRRARRGTPKAADAAPAPASVDGGAA
jgi:high-affinity iron transporter